MVKIGTQLEIGSDQGKYIGAGCLFHFTTRLYKLLRLKVKCSPTANRNLKTNITTKNHFSDERLVRGYIEDGYHVAQRGRIMFSTLPTARITNAPGSDLSCPAPANKPDFTLDGAWKVIQCS